MKIKNISIRAFSLLLFIIIFFRGIIFSAPNNLQSTTTKPRIAIITISTIDRNSFFQHSFKALAGYAKQWSYDVYVYRTSLDESRHPAWSKIKALMEFVAKEEYDWYVWIDDDIFITNPSISLESFIQKYEHLGDLIISQDTHFSVNSGFMLLKNTAWTKEFLKEVWEIGSDRYQWKPYWEQDAIVELLTQEKYSNKTVRTPLRELQSYSWINKKGIPRPGTAWQPGDYCLHLAGISNESRTMVFELLARDKTTYPLLPKPFYTLFSIDYNQQEADKTGIYHYHFIQDKQPKPHIALVTFSTPDRFVFSNHSVHSFKTYAESQKYDLYVYTKPIENNTRAMSWNKINILSNMLDQNRYDWIVWIDDEAIITNHEQSLEKFIKEYGNQADLVLSATQEALIGSTSICEGIILLKNSDWSKQFLKELWDLGASKYTYDQGGEFSAVIKCLQNNDNLSHAKLIPARNIQSLFTTEQVLQNVGTWHPGDFIAYTPWLEPHMRANIFMQLINNPHTLPHIKH